MFLLELVLKIVADGWCITFRNPWNCFDAFLVGASIPSLIFRYLDVDFINPTVFRLARLSRINRSLRWGVGSWMEICGLFLSSSSFSREGFN